MLPAACNLHTATALVSRIKALDIRASCSQLVMRPEAELQRHHVWEELYSWELYSWEELSGTK